MTSTSTTPTTSRAAPIPKSIIACLLVVLIVALISVWGGAPPGHQMSGFVIGIVIALLVSAGIATLAWVMLFRPEETATPRRSTLTIRQRSLIGAALIVGMTLCFLGGAWDEVWHSRYGIPFGEDFLWPPHILLYIGFLIPAVSAGAGWLAILRKGRGSLPQRFRGDPSIGFLMLTGLFLIYALPMDPIWHQFYGVDLTALSFPHVILTLFFTLVAITASAILLSAAPAKSEWKVFRRLSGHDGLALIGFTTILLINYLLLVSDWVNYEPGGPISGRPEWLLPTVIVLATTFAGSLANHSLRTVGTSTLIGIATIAVRFAVTQLLGHTQANIAMWLVPLPTLVMIDLVHAVVIRRGQTPGWLHTVAASAISLVGVLPLINALFIFPQISLTNLPLMIVMPVLASLAAAWLGQTIGNWIATRSSQPEAVEQESVQQIRWLLPAMMIPTLLLVALYMLVSAPPTG